MAVPESFCGSVRISTMISSAFVAAALAFTPASVLSPGASAPTSHRAAVQLNIGRRDALTTLGAAALSTTLTSLPLAAAAEGVKTVTVAGATGQTGRRVLSRLASGPFTAIGGVRNVDSAAKKLSESKIEIRGAMVEKGAAIDTAGVSLTRLDVEKDSVAAMTETLKGTDALVIATGFVPGNPFKMDAAAHAVDNVGTIALVDAAKAAGVKKVVLVSSILTDGGAWGKKESPGYVVTNAFGHVLEEKLVAEKYLRNSGLDWTIVRPGGLKATAPEGGLFISGENTLEAGEISRDLVADVCVAALTDAKSKNVVVEIVETEKGKSGAPTSAWFNGLKM